MRALSSTNNPLVKRIRALAGREGREAERKIAVEGVRMLEEVLASGLRMDLLLYDTDVECEPRAGAILSAARERGVRLVPASSRVVAACSSVETPQGLVGIVEKPDAAFSSLLHARALLVVADRIQDPGNLGTIIRISDAAGATGVVVISGSADPYNSKALRATMGSIFHVSVVEAHPAEARAAMEASGVRRLVADQTGAVDYADADYRPPVAIVLGNEGQGPDPMWASGAATTVRIPLYGRAESLNVAVAAGLLLYEARRKRDSRQ